MTPATDEPIMPAEAYREASALLRRLRDAQRGGQLSDAAVTAIATTALAYATIAQAGAITLAAPAFADSKAHQALVDAATGYVPPAANR